MNELNYKDSKQSFIPKQKKYKHKFHVGKYTIIRMPHSFSVLRKRIDRMMTENYANLLDLHKQAKKPLTQRHNEKNK